MKGHITRGGAGSGGAGSALPAARTHSGGSAGARRPREAARRSSPPRRGSRRGAPVAGVWQRQDGGPVLALVRYAAEQGGGTARGAADEAPVRPPAARDEGQPARPEPPQQRGPQRSEPALWLSGLTRSRPGSRGALCRASTGTCTRCEGGGGFRRARRVGSAPASPHAARALQQLQARRCMSHI